VADDPPAPVVQRLAETFSLGGGYLPAVYAALIDLPEAWSQGLAKLKTPSDYILSTYRGLGLPLKDGAAPLPVFEQLGQRTYGPGSPAGWPDRSADWDGASELLKRLEWADVIGQRIGSQRNALQLAPQLLGKTLTAATRKAVERAASASQAVTLLIASPEFMRR